MGKTSNYLLVIMLLITSINPTRGYAEVNATDYDAFWLWAGVKTQAVLDQANTLYILQGQIDSDHSGQAYFTRQGNGLIKAQPKQLWLVYRVHTLIESDAVYSRILKQLERWRLNGLVVTGIQLDFDVPTYQLSSYIDFLQTFRMRLPVQYKLSITGLMDWGVHAQPQELNQLSKIVDEVVLQTYQGRTTIDNYQEYLVKLKQLSIPFKIGLVQYGIWQAPDYLQQNPYFLGYVVFLQNK